MCVTNSNNSYHRIIRRRYSKKPYALRKCIKWDIYQRAETASKYELRCCVWYLALDAMQRKVFMIRNDIRLPFIKPTSNTMAFYFIIHIELRNKTNLKDQMGHEIKWYKGNSDDKLIIYFCSLVHFLHNLINAWNIILKSSG